MMMPSWTPAAEGAGFEFTPILQPLEPFRDQLLVVSGLQRRPRAPAPMPARRTRVPDRVSRQAVRLGARRRRLDGSDRREGARPSRRSSPRSSWRSRDATSRVRATSATAAPTRTPSRGGAPRRRCRWRTTRASCSSGCSATAARPTPARAARPHQDRPQHPRLGARTRRRAVSASSARATASKLSRVPRSGPRRRTPHPAGRGAERDEELAGRRAAGGRAGALRRAREADVRSAGARLPDRSDARHHLHDGARDQRPDVSGDRRARGASSDVAPSERPREDRDGWRRSTPST